MFIIAGCNGAGKTTASMTLLPNILNCKEFVKADNIAAGISPFQPETVSFEAGRIMLERINQLIKNKSDFAIETTLSTRSYKPKIMNAISLGYSIVLIFFYLNSPQLAIQRIKERVKNGGHFIEDEVVMRRYQRGLANLFSLFIPLADEWMTVDNSNSDKFLVAEGTKNGGATLYDMDIFGKIVLQENGK